MILHVIKSNIYSGAENVVCQIINGLEGEEDCIYLAPHGPIEDKLKSLGLYKYYRGIDKLSIASIKSAVADLHPDIVHAHDFTASVLCSMALKDSVPIISHLHNNPPWIKNINSKTLAYLFASKYFKQILVVSDSVKDEYRYSDRISCPMKVVGNPFSVDGVKNRTSQASSSDLLFVGRLTEQKNPLFILELVKALHNDADFISKKPDFTVRFVGDGELFNSCKNYIHSNHMESYVFLEGFKENAYSYMANTKALIMPSKWEGFGLVALEAMALGVPVVSSGNGGLSKIIDDSCGYKCSDKKAYLLAIKEILLDHDIYTKKSAGATVRAQVYDTIDDYIHQLKRVYFHATDTRRPILHVFKSNIYSGAENVACQIIDGLSSQERFIYFAPHGPIEKKLDSIALMESFRGYNKLNTRTVKKIIKKENVSIIHAHDFTTSIVCAIATRGRVPVISHLHQNPPWLKNVNLRTISFLFASRWFKEILTVSDAISTEFIYSDKLKAEVTVVGNPFSVKAIMNRADDAPVSDLLYVGRLEDAKNPLMALEILKAYNSKYAPVNLRMIGDGSLLNDCKNYIEASNLAENVILEGFLDNPYPYMAHSKLLIIPSKWEGFGLVALEGLSFGVPTICSGAGALPSIVSNCGFICSTIDDYVENIHALLTDTELYNEKSKSAKNRALEYDNMDTYVSEIKKLYSSLV